MYCGFIVRIVLHIVVLNTISFIRGKTSKKLFRIGYNSILNMTELMKTGIDVQAGLVL